MRQFTQILLFLIIKPYLMASSKVLKDSTNGPTFGRRGFNRCPRRRLPRDIL